MSSFSKNVANILATSPRSIRDDKRIKERFEEKAKKAFEKYKVDLEIHEARKMKYSIINEMTTEEISEAMDMYIIDSEKNKRLNDPLSDSGTMLPEIKDNFMIELIKFFKRVSNCKSGICVSIDFDQFQMHVNTRFELTWKQFMCITFSLQVPLPYLVRHIDMMYKWGARKTYFLLVKYFSLKLCKLLQF